MRRARPFAFVIGHDALVRKNHRQQYCSFTFPLLCAPDDRLRRRFSNAAPNGALANAPTGAGNSGTTREVFTQKIGPRSFRGPQPPRGTSARSGRGSREGSRGVRNKSK